MFVFNKILFSDDGCKMNYLQLQKTQSLLMVMVMCVGISQVSMVVLMIISMSKRSGNKANRLADIKKSGCARIKNIADTFHNYQQQDLVTLIKCDEVEPLV
jgi:hypothetical protein